MTDDEAPDPAAAPDSEQWQPVVPESSKDIDERFAAIVAHWDREPETPSSEPIGERLEPLEPFPAGPAEFSGHPPQAAAPGRHTEPELEIESDPDGEQLFGWRGYTTADDEEHFEPPPPELPPVHDATYWLAVLGMCAGPLVVIWAAFLSRNPDPGWWVVLGIVLTAAGFGLMVLRGSTERDPDDNGARV